jgi:translation elongation factor EF-Tu-like GTPase
MPLKKSKKKKLKSRARVKKVAKKKILKKKPVKKVIKKKVTKKKVIKKKAAASLKKENILGEITHYFPKVRAGVIKLSAPLKVGDVVRIKGHTTDFKQEIVSMQIDRVSIQQAKKGDEIGILVKSRVRKKDQVTKP